MFPLPLFGRKTSANLLLKTLFLDQLTDTNGTAMAAHTPSPINLPVASWSLQTDISGAGTCACTIQSNKAAMVTAGGSGNRRGYVKANFGKSDGIITCTIGTDASNNAMPGIIVRYTDVNNFLYIRINTADLIEIGRRLTGTFSVLASVAYDFTQGQTYTIKAILKGPVITGVVGGTSVSASETNFQTVTTHGFGVLASTDGTNTFDDYTFQG